MTNRLRRSLAAKLIAGGCVLALVVVGGVAGYLIASRAAQTQTAALSNADNRAGVMAEVLSRFTGTESLSAATSLAAQPALAAALAGPDAATAVPALVSAGAPVDVDGTVLAVTDRGGNLLVSRPSPVLGSTVVLASAPPAMTVALDGGRCTVSAATSTAGGCGVETLDDGQPAYDVAVPVTSRSQVVGERGVGDAAPVGART